MLTPIIYLISEALPQLAILFYHYRTFSAMDKEIQKTEEDRSKARDRYAENLRDAMRQGSSNQKTLIDTAPGVERSQS